MNHWAGNLYWVWHGNRWVLAYKFEDGRKWQIVQLDRTGDAWDSSIIQGPMAGVIKDPPADKPHYIFDEAK